MTTEVSTQMNEAGEAIQEAGAEISALATEAENQPEKETHVEAALAAEAGVVLAQAQAAIVSADAAETIAEIQSEVTGDLSWLQGSVADLQTRNAQLETQQTQLIGEMQELRAELSALKTPPLSTLPADTEMLIQKVGETATDPVTAIVDTPESVAEESPVVVKRKRGRWLQ